jgi:hypothetical protein
MRRQATVSAVDTATGTCTVQLAGDPTNLAGIAYLASYTPSVNDVVWVDQLETDWLVIGAQVPALSPPRGIIAEARRTANQTGITTITDLTGLTITFTAWPGRTYKVRGEVVLESTVVADIPKLSLTDGSNNLLKQSFWVVENAGQGIPYNVELSFNALTGSNTFKLRAERNAGAATITMDASAANPAWLRLEDIGPAVTYL